MKNKFLVYFVGIENPVVVSEREAEIIIEELRSVLSKEGRSPSLKQSFMILDADNMKMGSVKLIDLLQVRIINRSIYEF